MPFMTRIFFLLLIVSLSLGLESGSDDLQALVQDSANDPSGLLADASRVRKGGAATTKVTTTATTKAPITAPATGAKTISATIKPGSFLIVNTPLKKDYSEVDCNYIKDSLRTYDPELCCFGLTPLFSEETLFSSQLKNNLKPDWYYKGPSDNDCVVQCMFESMNLLVDNTTINKELVAAQLLRNKAHDRPIWEEIVSKAIDHCTTPGKTQYNATGPVPSTCTPILNLVLRCLHVQLYKNCPANNLNKHYYCKSHLEFVKVCDFIPKFGITKIN